MKLSTYLYFAGNCKEALEFYEKVAGAKVVFSMPFGGSPAEDMMPPGWEEKILHATVELGGQSIMASDALPSHSEKMGGFSICLETDEVEEAKRLFGALTEDGQVSMPIAPTFWSPMFGMGKDRFGTPWIVSAAGEP